MCARAIDAAIKSPAAEREHLSGYRVARDRLSLQLLELSSRLGSYAWDEAEASELMRGISLAVKDECEAMTALPEWPGALHQVPLGV